MAPPDESRVVVRYYEVRCVGCRRLLCRAAAGSRVEVLCRCRAVTLVLVGLVGPERIADA